MDEIWSKAEKEVAEQKTAERATQLEEAKAKFISDRGISLEAKDVQFDMMNNLDSSFVLVGTAELGTYFNYGFRDLESTHFSVKVRPDGEESNDYWNIYFDRGSFEELYNDLKAGQRTIIIKAQIPSDRYEQNQGNLAIGETAQW